MATKKPSFHINAGMVELADSGDLGSPAKSVRVRVPLPAPGANPFELGVGRRMLLTIRRSAFPYAEVAQSERAEE